MASYYKLIARDSGSIMDAGRYDIQHASDGIHIGWSGPYNSREKALAKMAENRKWFTDRGYEEPGLLEWNGTEWATVPEFA